MLNVENKLFEIYRRETCSFYLNLCFFRLLPFSLSTNACSKKREF